jgi:hypothetical protein
LIPKAFWSPFMPANFPAAIHQSQVDDFSAKS